MIKFDVKDGIAVLEIDAPGKNAISIEDMTIMADILENKCDGIGGLILTGADRSFCSGLMLHGNQFEQAFPLLDRILVDIYTLPCPVVCALSGHAIGAGFLMMCCADVVYATDSMKAKYGLPEVKIDLGIDQLMTAVLEERLSSRQISKLLFTGEYILRDTMEEWGVIDKSFSSPEEMIAASEEFVRFGAQHSKSYAFSKRLVRSERSKRLKSLLDSECFREFMDIL